MLTTLKTGYFLGVDAGGTKTEAVISNESGFVLGKAIAGGANPHNLGIEDSWNNIVEAVKLVTEKVLQDNPHLEITHFESACLGFAGIDTITDRNLVTRFINQLPSESRTLGSKRLVLVNDGLIGLRSASTEVHGICLIAGTGAECYGISSSGQEAVAGGWGYLLGDQASSFNIGQSILKQVFREIDGRASKTLISRKVCEFLELDSVEDIVSYVYKESLPIKEIASLSYLCDDEQLSDTIEMSHIVNQAVGELVAAYRAVVTKLELQEHDELPVVLLGGLFSMKGKFSNHVIRSILNLTPNANVLFPSKTPAEGALSVAEISYNHKLLPETAITFMNPKAQTT